MIELPLYVVRSYFYSWFFIFHSIESSSFFLLLEMSKIYEIALYAFMVWNYVNFKKLGLINGKKQSKLSWFNEISISFWLMIHIHIYDYVEYYIDIFCKLLLLMAFWLYRWCVWLYWIQSNDQNVIHNGRNGCDLIQFYRIKITSPMGSWNLPTGEKES